MNSWQIGHTGHSKCGFGLEGIIWMITRGTLSIKHKRHLSNFTLLIGTILLISTTRVFGLFFGLFAFLSQNFPFLLTPNHLLKEEATLRKRLNALFRSLSEFKSACTILWHRLQSIAMSFDDVFQIEGGYQTWWASLWKDSHAQIWQKVRVRSNASTLMDFHCSDFR